MFCRSEFDIQESTVNVSFLFEDAMTNMSRVELMEPIFYQDKIKPDRHGIIFKELIYVHL